MPKTGRLWVAIDVNFWTENADYGVPALVFFQEMLFFAKSAKTPGCITLAQALKLDRDAEYLLAGLCQRPPVGEPLVRTDTEGEVFLLRGWSGWNGEAKEQSALSEARARAGRSGGLASGRARQGRLGDEGEPQQTLNQVASSIEQSKEQELASNEARVASPRGRPKTDAPRSLALTAEQRAKTVELAFDAPFIDNEIDAFLDWHRSKGNKHSDWVAAWWTWCRKAAQFGTTKREGPAGGGLAPATYDPDAPSVFDRVNA